MKIKRLIFLITGCVCLALGCIGIVLPVLPTVPFFLATVFCFSQSSQKLHDWFLGTRMYKNNLASYVKGQGMTAKTKTKIWCTVTALMAFGFVMMLRKGLHIPCAILAVVWAAHIVYFIFFVKIVSPAENCEPEEAPDEEAEAS